MKGRTAIIKILRKRMNSDEAKYEEYQVPLEENKNVLQVLLDIFDSGDRSLSFRRNRCNRGVCGSCIMIINGKLRRACITMMTQEMIIEPANKKKTIKDLVINFNNIHMQKELIDE
ncbi:2Fe-2S iron-sulfur cluster-binding protein [Petroclostridium sp. X23]|jgi:succinate dehydrogenase/fumarate reductase-like Fe-S protein|uniref:2Fe-2S iron-sulfur cluster-binding protein n=1 Tax=Petroclostridium sp. X23 TaxID=3045146 RepID=UPI0024AE2EBA|nr:2Fe-2S iron-sulfur cluster-binding protein [Petroclostridium sp. X23]WHH57931.1 2Fe-2S iron-sulfur cluster-binding protein [Petroclostridium sp. X23]